MENDFDILLSIQKIYIQVQNNSKYVCHQQ